MITEEERQSIINEAVEKALLMLPEVVGNLIMHQIELIRTNKKFYDQFPEFTKSKDIVASVVEKVDADNPGLDYKTILDKAVPLIKERLQLMRGLDMKTVKRPDRNLAAVKFDKNDLGEL